MVVGARNSSAANNSASFQDSENHCCRLPNLPRLPATATLMSENYWRNQKKMEKEKKMLVFSQFSQRTCRLFRCLFPLNMYIEEKYIFTQNLKLNEITKLLRGI